MRYYIYITLIFFSLSSFIQAEEKTKVDKALDRAVSYLLKQQKKDGGIYQSKYQTSMTALAIMAFAALGHMPDDKSPEGKAMKLALDFVLDERNQEFNGYFGKRFNSRMYGHGIITLMLSEMHGMGADEKQNQQIKKRLTKALDLITWSQKQKSDKNKPEFGGWRYEPKTKSSDLSITIWQLMALRSAYDAGLAVPKEAIDNAVIYLRKCYHSNRKDGKPTNLKSAFGYTPGKTPNYAMAAAGVLAMQVSGEYDSLEVKGARDWLMSKKVNYHEHYFFYGTYYFAQSMYQAGGKYAEKAKKTIEDTLLKNQQPDGSWQAHTGEEKNAGRTYAACMGILSLSVTQHFLPIYQR
jgi:hypothetical protein